MATKHVLRSAAIAGVLVLAAGCSSTDGADPSSTSGSASDDDGTITIGASFRVFDEYQSSLADSLEESAEAVGADLTVVSADDSADAQVGQVENFIAQGVDGLIVTAVDTTATGPITDAALDAGIPLVYVNGRPDDLPDGVSFVGSDNYDAGTIQMTELARLAGGTGNVVILQGDAASEYAVQRTQAVQDVVAENPGMEVTMVQVANWSRDDALSITENWIQSGSDFTIVAANNDEMALGAVRALDDAGMLDGVLVGGVDATVDALAAVLDGSLTLTVRQDAAQQAAAAIDVVVKRINGEDVEAEISIPFSLVTKDNAAEYQN